MAASLRYMGSKRSLAPRIGQIISESHKGAIVVDAFAGTCAVASAVAPRHTVYANDVHEYASTIARALLSNCASVPTEADVMREVAPAYRINLNALFDVIGHRIEAERQALAATGGRQWRQLYSFTHEELAKTSPFTIRGLDSIRDYRMDHTLEPYALFSLLYSSTYFGVEQAAQIDSLRAAIDAARPSRRDFYLLALFESVSHCAAAPGHFAQYLVPRDRANTHLVARFRRRNVWERFVAALSSIAIPKYRNRAQNRVFNGNAQEFLTRRLHPIAKKCGPIVIYADPPYSRAQYSRYYHVLETLAHYDYPLISGKGRYRDTRFNTNFSRTAQVLTAMSQFLGAAANTGAELYLSYPTNGLVHDAGGDIRDLLKRRFKHVLIVHSQPLAHSTMGGAPGRGSMEVTENVYHAFN